MILQQIANLIATRNSMTFCRLLLPNATQLTESFISAWKICFKTSMQKFILPSGLLIRWSKISFFFCYLASLNDSKTKKVLSLHALDLFYVSYTTGFCSRVLFSLTISLLVMCLAPLRKHWPCSPTGNTPTSGAGSEHQHEEVGFMGS